MGRLCICGWGRVGRRLVGWRIRCSGTVGRWWWIEVREGFLCFALGRHEGLELGDSRIDHSGVALAITCNEARVGITQAGQNLQRHAVSNGNALEDIVDPLCAREIREASDSLTARARLANFNMLRNLF